MLKVHDITQKYYHHQSNVTDSTKVAANFDRIIQKISDSVNSSAYLIVETKNLETIEFSQGACNNLTQNQRKPLFDKITTTRAKIVAFSKDLKND